MGLFLRVGWSAGCMYLRNQLGQSGQKIRSWAWADHTCCSVVHHIPLVLRDLHLWYETDFHHFPLRLASNGENIGQAIIGLLYGYIARGAAGGGSDQGDGPSDGGGGHFGSEPGAKLFDPAILDFGAAGRGKGKESEEGWTDWADGLRCRRRGARVREFHDRFQGGCEHITSTQKGIEEFAIFCRPMLLISCIT